MKSLQVAMGMTAIGLVLSIWLLLQVSWYNFVVFMFVAQPLVLVALVMFARSAFTSLKRRRGA